MLSWPTSHVYTLKLAMSLEPNFLKCIMNGY